MSYRKFLKKMKPKEQREDLEKVEQKKALALRLPKI